MEDLGTALSTLKRPQLLVRAARAGLLDYNRKRVLRRLIGTETPPTPADALDRLMKLEREADDSRRAGAAHYSILRHVELLIALLGEARLARG